MERQRVNCCLAGCDRCSKAEFVGKNIFDEKLYKCPAYKRKHKKKYGEKCEFFRCNKPERRSTLCYNCNKGR